MTDLSNQTGLVRSNRIEVAQADDVPTGIGFLQISQNRLNEELCLTVRIGDADANWMLLVERQVLRNAIHSGRAAEDHILNAVFLHRLQQIYRRLYVVLIISQRLLTRLADSFEAGEMNATAEGMPADDVSDGCFVQ